MSTELWALVPIAAILGFWFYLISSSQAKARVRELEIRERIAMIEKGLVPAPEVDPLGFDRATAIYEYRRKTGTHRHRSAGVTLIGVGLGLMVMIGFAADDPQKAIGVGGFIVMLGIAFLINSIFGQPPREADELARANRSTAPPPMETPKVD